MSPPQDNYSSEDVGPDGQDDLSNSIDPYKPRPSPPAGAGDDDNDDVAHFLAIPWCRAHLQPAENSPAGAAGPRNIRIVMPHARRQSQTGLRWRNPVPKPLGGLSDPSAPDTLFTTTLNTADTLKSFILFYEEPAASSEGSFRPPIVEIKALLTLGSGINGHPGVLHGGIVATILDEVLGLLMPLNTSRDRYNKKHGLAPQTPAQDTPKKLTPPEEAAAASAHCHNGLVTGYLNTTYVKPVLTLASILVTARFVRCEGSRKFFVEASVWDEKATLRAKGEALFIALKQRL